jgi:predicted esterase
MADFTSRFIQQLKLNSIYLMGWSDGANTALIVAAIYQIK